MTEPAKPAAHETRYLAAEEVLLAVTAGRLLQLELDGETHQPVNLYRCFPLSAGERFISIRASDGSELGVVEDLQDLPAATRALIATELEQRYFTPEILRIRSLKEEFGYTYWEVDTPAGVRRFTAKSGQNAVRELDRTTLLVVDVDGNRFNLSQYQRLPSALLKTIETIL